MKTAKTRNEVVEANNRLNFMHINPNSYYAVRTETRAGHTLINGIYGYHLLLALEKYSARSCDADKSEAVAAYGVIDPESSGYDYWDYIEITIAYERVIETWFISKGFEPENE